MSAFQSQDERLKKAVESIRFGSSLTPRVALVLGSGLGGLAEEMQEGTVIHYADIPHMPRSSVVGHAGKLVLGMLESVPIVSFAGRVHLYEGYAPEEVVFGVRLAIRLGAQVVMLTNAAGGIETSFQPGDLMVLDDHVNLTGANCLVGVNEEKLGPRFPDMSEVYDKKLRALADDVAKEAKLTVRHGVYAGVLGPSYETPAEIRMLRTFGAHAVGMSTVHEAIAARHMGARVLGISCITNLAAGVGTHTLCHDEVQATAQQSASRFQNLIRGILQKIAKEGP